MIKICGDCFNEFHTHPKWKGRTYTINETIEITRPLHTINTYWGCLQTLKKLLDSRT